MYKVQQNEAKAYENSANIWIINMGGGSTAPCQQEKYKSQAKADDTKLGSMQQLEHYQRKQKCVETRRQGDTLSG